MDNGDPQRAENLKAEEFPFAGLLPELERWEYEALKAHIGVHGVLVPVELDEQGQILDGHHRVRAWTELRAEGRSIDDYPTMKRLFRTEQEKLDHIIALDLARRHKVRREARQNVAAMMRSWGMSNGDIARRLSVDEITIRRDLKGSTFVGPPRVKGRDGKSYPARTPTSIQTTSRNEERGATEVLERWGEDAKPGVYTLAKARALANQAIYDRQKKKRVAKRTDGPLYRIEHCSFLDLELEDESVDLLLCDPPYLKEHMPIFSDLSKVASRILKPGRPLIAYVGKHQLPEEIARLGENLNYVWQGATVTRGRKTGDPRLKINGSYRPWLVFSNGKYVHEGRWFTDTITELDGNGIKEIGDHPWKQDEAPFRELIEKLTAPGDLIVDPFVGSGTTATAAVKLKRRFVGCDNDPAWVSMTLKNLRKLDSGTEGR